MYKRTKKSQNEPKKPRFFWWCWACETKDEGEKIPQTCKCGSAKLTINDRENLKSWHQGPSKS